MKSTIKSAKTVDEAIELGLKDLGLSRSEIEFEILEDAKSGFLGIFGSKDAIVKISEKQEFKIDINDIYGKKAQEEQKKEEQRLAKEKLAKEKLEEAKRLEAEKKAEAERLRIEEERSKAEVQVKAQEQQEPEKVLDDKKDSLDMASLLEMAKKELEDILEMMHIKARIEEDLDQNTLNFNLVDISEEDTGIIIGRKGETLDSLQYILSLMANKKSSEFVRVTLNVANYRMRRKETIENNARKVAFKVIKTKKSIALEPMNSYERRIVHYALQKYKEVETISQGSFPNRKVVIKYKG
ncbi:MAG: RNA-binding cell elongation regulator Jag/EloR [Tissierellia bacterium]|nr:RNA-binding cell elongation regulator Jag/EloR [Tissierellia bacterium]